MIYVRLRQVELEHKYVNTFEINQLGKENLSLISWKKGRIGVYCVCVVSDIFIRSSELAACVSV